MFVVQDKVLYDTNCLKFDSTRAPKHVHEQRDELKKWMNHVWNHVWRRSLWLGAKQNGLNPTLWVDMVIKVNEWVAIFFNGALAKVVEFVMEQFVVKNGPS